VPVGCSCRCEHATELRCGEEGHFSCVLLNREIGLHGEFGLSKYFVCLRLHYFGAKIYELENTTILGSWNRRKERLSGH
jgi:hypothetical protein